MLKNRYIVINKMEMIKYLFFIIKRTQIIHK